MIVRIGKVAAMVIAGCASLATANDSEWVYRGVTGRLIYAPDAEGDRVPDFSDVGYRGGKVAIPSVAAAVTVSPIAGDDTAHVQAAIDQVAALPLGPDGFRGAVELSSGEFQIGGQLRITDSGIVLRGAGRDAGGTVLRGTGTGQRDLIEITGSGSQQTFGSTRNLIDKVVPVGSRSFRVDVPGEFSVGDTVRVERPSTAKWISDLGMDSIPPRPDGGTVNQWQPGSFNLRYDRVVTRIEGDRVFVDAPLTNSFDQQYGGGTIKRYRWNDRIENIGVENLRAESDFTSPTDEDHAWNFVSIDKAQNVWVRDTASAHFGRSAVLSNPGAKWITVSNARNETPVSLITGSRRYTFDLSGQLELVTGSEANDGRHDFVNNSTRPPGPHVFHDSVANNALNDSGPHQRWATGSLFDNITVHGDEINARNRGNFGSGHGWSGANMVIWNSTADGFIVQNPPTAQNWLVGSTGTVIDDQTFGPQPPGYIDSHGQRVAVDSLYESQVADAAEIDTFVWGGGAGAWSDPEAWVQRVTPGNYAVETRDYLIGDIDGLVNDGPTSVDAAPIDPAWRAAIEAESALPLTGFDDANGNRNVAFTIQHQLDADERVVHGSLALSLTQVGGTLNTDFVRLFETGAGSKMTFADLGWDTEISSSTPFVGVLDLGGETERLQSGSVNVQVNDDTAVDWALYTVTVASPTGANAPKQVRIASGEASIDADEGQADRIGVEAGVLEIKADGAITAVESYTQAAAATLRVEVGAGGSGELTVAGDASFDGGLELTLEDGFTPGYGDEFNLITTGGNSTGEFSTVVAPALPGGLGMKLQQAAGGVTAVVVLVGDYNGDGVVDAADYTVWRDAVGGADLVADGNNDGVVNAADRDVWAAAFGASASAASGVSTPEPAAAALAALSGSCLLTISRRRL